MKLLPGAVAQLQHQIAQVERQTAPASVSATPARYPLAPDQIALSHYHQRLAFDDELRNDVRHSMGYVDDLLVQRLRDAMAGKLTDIELASLIGPKVERFRAAGSHTILLPTRTGITNAVWVGETAARTASEPTFGQSEITVKELATYLDLSLRMLEDSGSVEAEVRLALAEDFGALDVSRFGAAPLIT